MIKYHEILSNKIDPVVMVDQDGIIQDINTAFKENGRCFAAAFERFQKQ